MRSGARGKIHPFKDDPSVALPVRFYRVPRDTPILEIPTTFLFDQWDKEGELEAFPGFEFAYQWDRGLDTRKAPGAGYCGTLDQWLNGPSTTDNLPPINPATGLPVCCGPAPLETFGGQAEGGLVQAIPVAFESVGGQAEGGISLEGVLSAAAGGQAEGGISLEGVLSAAAGGQAEGGITIAPGVVPYTGGQAEGGISLEGVLSAAAGGQAEGGISLEGVLSAAAGGQAEGGISLEGVLSAGEGGHAEGKTEPPYTVGVKTIQCANYISTRLRLTFTTKIGTCSCLPAFADFQWDGSGWQGVTNYSGCTGTNLNLWRITNHATAPALRLNDTVLTVGFTSPNCGPPLTATITRTGPSYCSGAAMRGWIGNLTEV